MIRRRDRPDGLPFRVYERRGVRDYSIGYKLPSGVWAFRLRCAISRGAPSWEFSGHNVSINSQVAGCARSREWPSMY